MAIEEIDFSRQIYSNFRIFLELMSRKIREVLLVSSPYDAFIMEEDGTLASRIITEYSGLNLSMPPRVTRASAAREALDLLERRDFDMVIVTPHLDDSDPLTFASDVKKKRPGLPVNLLAYGARGINQALQNVSFEGIDRVYIWTGNSDLLLALVKNAEDKMNVDNDTKTARVRVLILVEDSPIYYSILLPYMYKEVVRQTQAVLQTGLNEEHRLLTMRARPKILLAHDFDEALTLYNHYRPYLLGVFSDTRYPLGGTMDDFAGVKFLSQIRKELPFLPLLMMSTDPSNSEKAREISASFVDKNSPHLFSEINDFFLNHLGFGDFVFRKPDGKEIARARNLKELEEKVSGLPDSILMYHAERNHFSTWIMARSEITLASVFREVAASDFPSAAELRDYIVSHVHTLRKWRQKGIITTFNREDFDADVTDFVRIGNGSMGGKARGLAFLTNMLIKHSDFLERYKTLTVDVPKTLVLCTDVFESFMGDNHLERCIREELCDDDVFRNFLAADLPGRIIDDLAAYLEQVTHPLAVRPSSLLQDAHVQPLHGLYRTIMLPNNEDNLQKRLHRLLRAIKLVYASSFTERTKEYFRKIAYHPREEAMGVIIQRLVGQQTGDFFYPAISGSAHSHNFYPVSHMKADEGICKIVLGLGKTLREEDGALRFSPRYPQTLPQFSTVENILKNAQRYFYALDMNGGKESLVRRTVNEAWKEYPIQMLSSTYAPDERYIRDTGFIAGPKIVTFASILKDRLLPLPEVLEELLRNGRQALGCPVEIDFAVNLDRQDRHRGSLYLLSARPMIADKESMEVQITAADRQKALCISHETLGHGIHDEISDIVYVKRKDFRIDRTADIAREIGSINGALLADQRPYLLVGPGRWGSSDRWLGIPVKWQDISGVGAIIELRNEHIKADSSMGFHFFKNITAQGIPYITVTEGSEDLLEWPWFEDAPICKETVFLRHIRLEKPLTIKIDGRKSMSVILPAAP
ncbi:MAG: phosphoenolpyruvate synthase/pyruvate phosphate dikinase [Deltaproteobacteria bacterium]|nr:phosphoenolpyruvate synthase/pyruvate phosphate dikinase [Deltaproteobacteria bacterium]